MKEIELLAQEWEKRAADFMVKAERSTFIEVKIGLNMAAAIWQTAALELQNKIDNINS